MSTRMLQIEKLPLPLPADAEPGSTAFLEVSLRFDDGGTSYFSGNRKPRGFYLIATPTTERDGMTTFVLCSGKGHLIEVAPRFNAKRLSYLAATVKATESYKALIAGFPVIA